MLQRGPQHHSKRRHCALGATAETDDFQPLDAVVLQRTSHLVEEPGQIGRVSWGGR